MLSVDLESAAPALSKGRPHFRQNLAPRRLGSPQVEHGASSCSPHWSQKTTSLEFSVLHRGHIMVALDFDWVPRCPWAETTELSYRRQVEKIITEVL
jgi:hypothetical protein